MACRSRICWRYCIHSDRCGLPTSADRQKRLALASRFIENGLSAPRELFVQDAQYDLRKGIILILTGIGVYFAALAGEPTKASWGRN